MGDGHREQWCREIWALRTVGPWTIDPRMNCDANDGVADDGATDNAVANNGITDDGAAGNISTGDRVLDNRTTADGHC